MTSTKKKGIRLPVGSNVRGVLLAVAFLVGFIFLVSLSIYMIKEHYGLSCGCRLSLPIFVAVLASLGVFVGIITYYFLSQSFSEQAEKMHGAVEKTLDFLEQEEKNILVTIIKHDGQLSQRMLSEKTGIDAVKLHRRLAVLVAKGVLRKEKHGMTNMIFLEDDFKELFVS